MALFDEMPRVEGERLLLREMVDNGASGRVLDKAGFVLLYPNCWEDWGRGENVLVDKWVYKRRWRESGPDAPI